MTKALSVDLRRRVTSAIAQGKSRWAATEQFAISAATAVRLQKRLEETGSVEPDQVGRPRGSGKLGPYREIIIARVETQPDITMPDGNHPIFHGFRFWISRGRFQFHGGGYAADHHVGSRRTSKKPIHPEKV